MDSATSSYAPSSPWDPRRVKGPSNNRPIRGPQPDKPLWIQLPFHTATQNNSLPNNPDRSTPWKTAETKTVPAHSVFVATTTTATANARDAYSPLHQWTQDHPTTSFSLTNPKDKEPTPTSSRLLPDRFTARNR